MPLVRFAVRNEYGLGVPELYKDAVQVEDPKAVLDGVSVAGLVGILRQLGDLAEFAAEVFHGLQEQVASTASRSRKLVTRVQRVEASLPQLEKAILSQTSHIHFAYTPGSEWHARIRNRHNLFICDDLPHFIMDSYEECREPPRLQLLDRFDTGGSGSCLKRYSDPTFFRRASARSEVPDSEKSQRGRKARKIKRRRSRQRSGRFPNCASVDDRGRMQLSSPTVQEQYSPSNTGSTFETTLKSDLGGHSETVGSKEGTEYIECVFHPSTSIQPDDVKTAKSSSRLDEEMTNAHKSIYLDEQTANAGACSPTETTIPHSSNVTWDEKMEIVEPVGLTYGFNDVHGLPEISFDLDEQGLKSTNVECEQRLKSTNVECINQVDDLSEYGSLPKSNVDGHCPKTMVGNIQDVPKTNIELDERELKPVRTRNVDQVDGLSERGSYAKSHADGHYPKAITNGSFMEPNQPTGLVGGIDEVQYTLENFEIHDHDLEPVNMECNTQVADLSENENTSESIADGDRMNDPMDSKLGTSSVLHVFETNFGVNQRELEAISMESAGKGNAFSESENAVTVIEWNDFDDIESETDNYVDALNTIDSESESEFESQTKKEIELFSSSTDALVENTSNEKKPEITYHQEPENECYSVSYDHEEGTTDVSQHSMALVSSDNMESLEHVQSNECDSVSSDNEEGMPDVSQHSMTLVSSANMESLEHAQSNECHSVSYDHKEGMPDVSQHSMALVSSANMEPLARSQSKECHSVSFDHEEGTPDVSQHSMTLVSSPNMESLGHAQSSERHSVSYDHEEGTPDVSQQSIALVSSANMESLGHVQSSEHHSVSYDHEEGTLDISQQSMALVSSANMVSLGHAQSSCNALAAIEGKKLVDSSAPNISQGIDVSTSSSHNISEGNDFVAKKPAVSKIAASSLQVPPDEETIRAPPLSEETSVGPSCEEMPTGPSSTYPVAFWTNGTLLGLEPSKPNVFSTSNTVNSDPISSGKNIKVGQFHPMQKVDGSTGALDSSIKESEYCDSSAEHRLGNGDQDSGSSKHMSDLIADKKHDQSVDHDRSKMTDHSMIQNLSNGDVRPHETTAPIGAHLKNVSNEAIYASEDKSSLLSVLGRGLLKNGLRRTASLGYEEKPKTINSLSNNYEDGCLAAGLHSMLETNLKGKSNTPVNSPPPSPPLEHMKISFRPIDGFESSRLKLKYPEGVDHHEISVDTFPSFQLVPEPTNLKHDVGSDSDDDTFCRSYACMSDDNLSHLSDSNSEEWESGDTSENNDHTLYDGLRRISSAESTSSSPQHEETAHGNIDFTSRFVGAVHSDLGPSLDLPILDTKNPFACQETKLCLNPETDSSHFQQPTPQTPPLPPLQWRVSRPMLDAEGGKLDSGSNSLNQSVHPNASLSIISRLAKVDSANVPNRSEDSVTITKTNKLEKQKSDPQIQDYQAANGSRADDKEDFLHQIRTKSFNLRRTDTARSTYTTSAATNKKVTAILQKANAIRRAVGSDGEDDSWSDT